MTSFMDNIALVPSTSVMPTTSIVPTTISLAPGTMHMPTSNLTITVKKERKPIFTTVAMTLAIGLAIIMAALLGPKLVRKTKELLKEPELPKVEPPTRPEIPENVPLWMWRSPSLRYPDHFYEGLTLDQPLPQHRPTHPYFVTRSQNEMVQHLILTSTAAANQAHITDILFNVRATHLLKRVVDQAVNKPHTAAATKVLVDLLVNVIELEALHRHQNHDAFTLVWLETKSLLENGRSILKAEQDKLDMRIKNASWKEKTSLKNDRKEIKGLKDLVHENFDKLIHNMALRYSTYVVAPTGNPVRYSRQIETSRAKNNLQALFGTICLYMK